MFYLNVDKEEVQEGSVESLHTTSAPPHRAAPPEEELRAE